MLDALVISNQCQVPNFFLKKEAFSQLYKFAVIQQVFQADWKLGSGKRGTKRKKLRPR